MRIDLLEGTGRLIDVDARAFDGAVVRPLAFGRV
jgi:hypothetical protein